jgi:hypothetical protein
MKDEGLRKKIPAVPVNMGFDGSGSPDRISRHPKRREERIFHGTVKVDYAWIRACILRVGHTQMEFEDTQ